VIFTIVYEPDRQAAAQLAATSLVDQTAAQSGSQHVKQRSGCLGARPRSLCL
jgi:hypothetical protein